MINFSKSADSFHQTELLIRYRELISYSETTTVKDAITSIDVLLKSDKTGLATRLENIESALKNIIGQFSTMVTDVQLFNIAQPNYTGFNRTLNFVQASEQANVFPAEANTVSL